MKVIVFAYTDEIQDYTQTKKMIFAVSLSIPFLMPQAVHVKPVRYEITRLPNGEDRYLDPSEFLQKIGGSLSVHLPAKASDALNISTVYVTVGSSGISEIAVRGFMGDLNEWETVH
jgi:hypothetical protein